MMKKTVAAASPDAYVGALRGWRRRLVEELREAVTSAATLDEVIKWRNLVYMANGPVAVIRAEEERVLLTYFRGQLLRDIEPRLKPGGKYEMATIALREGMSIAPAVVRKLTKQAVALNKRRGDPTQL